MDKNDMNIDEALALLAALRQERSGNTAALVGTAEEVAAFFSFIEQNTTLHNGGNITFVGDYRGQKLELKKL